MSELKIEIRMEKHNSCNQSQDSWDKAFMMMRICVGAFEVH